MHILSACFSISHRLSILDHVSKIGSRGIVILPFWKDVATVSFFEIKSASVLDSLIHNLFAHSHIFMSLIQALMRANCCSYHVGQSPDRAACHQRTCEKQCMFFNDSCQR